MTESNVGVAKSALPVDESIDVEASPERVWRVLADPELLAAWWYGMDLTVAPGGGFEERWLDEQGDERITRGRVESCVPGQELVLSWADDDWQATTWVEITISAVTRTTSRLRIRHLGWEKLPDGASLADAHRDGWRHHLANWARAAGHAPPAGPIGELCC
jgi:uncharacterized protein YndB with AHSA1/START domain